MDGKGQTEQRVIAAAAVSAKQFNIGERFLLTEVK